MSTIHFNQSKETVITASITVGLILMVVVNVVVLIPALFSVFVQSTSAPPREPIDVVAVDQAMQLILGTEE